MPHTVNEQTIYNIPANIKVHQEIRKLLIKVHCCEILKTIPKAWVYLSTIGSYRAEEGDKI